MSAYTDDPQTRVEAILQNILGKENLLQPPQTRVEELLLLILNQGLGGVTYKGVTTTPLTDGATTNPIVINGEELEVKTGDFVAYGGKEFVWNGEAWQELGDLSIVAELMDSIAPQYDPAETYNTGSLVFYDNVLYECNTDGTTGAWDSSKWDEVVLSDLIEELYAALARANVQETPTDTLKNIKIGNTVYGTTVTKVVSGSEYNSLTPEQKNDGTIYLVDTSKPELVPWSTGTDKQITAMVNAYYDGILSLNEIKSVWSLGDVRNIDLSAMEATGVGESHRAQTVQVEILDFDHDTLTTPVGNITKALITCDLKNCLRDANVSDTDGSSNTENGYMNSSNTNQGGWTSCARRTWCNNIFYNALPSYFKSLVKPVDKLTSAGNQSAIINTDSDYCFLLSEIEIFGSVTYSKAGEGTQYAWFTNATANRYKLPKWDGGSASDIWWERSPYGSSSNFFCNVKSNGNANYVNASNAYGIAPAFCL